MSSKKNRLGGLIGRSHVHTADDLSGEDSAPEEGAVSASDVDQGEEVIEVTAEGSASGEEDSVSKRKTTGAKVPPKLISSSPSEEEEPATIRDGSVHVHYPAVNTRSANSTRAMKQQTFYVAPELSEQLRDAVDLLMGPPQRLSVTKFINNAIYNELERLRSEHNEGKPFPKREAEFAGANYRWESPEP